LVCKNRELVITEFVVTEFDCIKFIVVAGTQDLQSMSSLAIETKDGKENQKIQKIKMRNIEA
jgi:hypothetical protein